MSSSKYDYIALTWERKGSAQKRLIVNYVIYFRKLWYEDKED